MRLLPWLQLVRLPNLPSAITNIVSGAAFGTAAGGRGRTGPILAACAASLCVYAMGLVFNEVSDAGEDRLHRPERPIPSGRISRRAAAILGAALLGCGAILCLWTEPRAGKTLALVAAMALLYDFFLKRSPGWGPLALALCRGGNWLAGVFSSGYSVMDGTLPGRDSPFPIFLLLFLYVFSLSSLARMEEVGFDRLRARVEFLGCAGSVLALGALLASFGSWVFLVGLTALALREWPSLSRPTPEAARKVVGTFLLGIYLLDAAIAFPGLGLWCLFLLVPFFVGNRLRGVVSPT